MPLFSKPYGAGYRAGMSEPEMIKGADGFLRLKPLMDICPYTKRLQFLSRHAWMEGWYVGTMKRLHKPVK